MRQRSPQNRRGLSLLEVLISLAIFLTFLAGMTQLLNICATNAIETQNLNRTTQLLQSQMNRVISGEIALSGQGDTPFDDDPAFSWSMTCDQDSSAPNLWHVTISVHHTGGTGPDESWSLYQLILDPSARGVIESSPSPSSSSSSSSTTGTGQPSSGGP